MNIHHPNYLNWLAQLPMSVIVLRTTLDPDPAFDRDPTDG